MTSNQSTNFGIENSNQHSIRYPRGGQFRRSLRVALLHTAGAKPFSAPFAAILFGVCVVLVFAGDAHAGGGNDPTQIVQTKTYTHVDIYANLHHSIKDELQSDDFPFQPTPGNYRAIINGGQLDDYGTIAGYSSPNVPPGGCYPVVCGGPDPSTSNSLLPLGYEIPASYISVVGNKLQVSIWAMACEYYGYPFSPNCGFDTEWDFNNPFMGYERLSITWIAKCDGCRSGACGAPGTSQHQNQCVNSTFSLGQTAFGASAGQLKLYGLTPGPQLATPSGLQAYTASGVQVITNAAGVRQVMAPQDLADIVINSATQYQINFYSAGNFSTTTNASGLFSTNPPPFKIVTIWSGHGTNDYNDILISESDTGVQTEYQWNPANQQWTLTSGSGLRQETRSVQWQGNTLIETNIVSDGTGKAATKTVYTYQVFPGAGNAVGPGALTATNLVQMIADPDGTSPLTSQWIYYSDTNNTAYGQVQMAIGPYGNWTRYEYDQYGQVTNEVSQFLDAPTNAANSSVRVVSRSYSGNQKTTITYLQGQEISRTYEFDATNSIQLIQCQTPGTTNSDPNNLVTTTLTYTNGSVFPGQPQSISLPDGTLSLYGYSTNATTITTVVDSGAPSTNGNFVVDGTRTVTITDLAGNLISQTSTDIASGLLVSSQVTSQPDQFGRPQMIVSLSGTNTIYYSCCGVGSITTAEGITTSYQYDTLKRVTATTVAGITTTNSFDAAGRMLQTVRIGSDSSVIRLNSSVYDLAGRLTYSTNALSFPTSYSETRDGSGHLVRTTLNPDSSTRIETYYQDGQLLSVTGTGVHGVRYEYGVEPDNGVYRPYTKEIKLNSNGTDAGEWTKTYTDMLGRPYKVVHADNSYNQSVYNNKGQLIQQTDEDGVTNGVTTLYTYNAKGQLETTAIDMNNDGTIEFGGTDRITQTEQSVVPAHGTTVHRTTTALWPTMNVDFSNVVSIADTSVDGLQSWTVNFGVTNQSQTVYAPGTASRTITATAPDGSQTVSSYQNGRLVSSVSTAGALALGSQSYSYDPHGRLAITTDNRSGTQTTNSYDAADEVLSTTVIPPGLPVQATSYQFDTMGRQTLVTLPDNGTVTSVYYSTGELATNSGARTYPVAFGYDYAGRMKTMTTWQNFAGNTGSATTTWNYDSLRGFLASKAYADNSSVIYSNSAAGRLLKRTWARTVSGQPLATTYAYTSAGGLGTITYSDGTTPNMIFGFDRQGRKTNVTDGTGGHALTYNDAGQLLAESFPNSGVVITNSYDGLLRRSSLSGIGVSPVQYGYDAASRLNAVTNGTYTASYSYWPNSSFISNVVFATGGVTKMTTTKSYDNLNRLTSISSSAATSPASSFAYQYNSANQHTQATLADGSYWVYTYDSLGQVTGGQKYWSDSSAVAGEQFGYTFDTIGNRQSITANGNTGTYTANTLNQYTQRTVPGAVWELGNAASNATVTVNLQSTTRKGQYFSEQLSVNNSSSAVYTQLVTVAVLKNAGSNQLDIVSTTTGKVFVAQTPESFSYDLDGNLVKDGRFTNVTWDAENRLISLETRTDVAQVPSPGVPRQKLLFGYDYQSRRISKVVSNWSGSAWTLATNLKFVYDAQNLIAELDSTNGVVRSYTWGNDLSGSMQGAGGIGGLLAVNLGANGTHFVAFDGNGNVTALVDANTGNISGQCDYGPFGELVRKTGAVTACTFRFSTKYQDDETGLLCYAYRYYQPSTGRWLSRDATGEAGTPNLFGFTANNPESFSDRDGLDFATWTGAGPYYGNWTGSGFGPPTLSGSWAMFFHLFLGNLGTQATLSQSLYSQIKNSRDYGGDKIAMLNQIKTQLKCGLNGTYQQLFQDPSFVINPSSSPVSMGFWQLTIVPDCTWRCETGVQGSKACCCDCKVRCDLTVVISKSYTFAPGYNPANSTMWTVKTWNAIAGIMQLQRNPQYSISGQFTDTYNATVRRCSN